MEFNAGQVSPSPVRGSALGAAVRFVDSGEYREELATLVRIETESQNPQRHDRLHAYLSDAIAPMLASMGFNFEVYDNPHRVGGPLLIAERYEGAHVPTVLLYGHGDVVAGHDGRWRDGRDPWVLDEDGDRLYGRGTADNKGQHLLNLLALQTVIDHRGGLLGFNVKVLFETSEEIGSVGLREFAHEHADLLRSEVLIASDGPRVSPEIPTVVLGLRGAINFAMTVDLRGESHHSGNWGGFIADPAIVLAGAIGAICSATGRINVPEWRPAHIDSRLREALEGCPFDPGASGDRPDDWWGEPGLSVWEKTALWPSFSVLAIDHGDPANPVNAVQARSVAYCGLRYPTSLDAADILPALRRFLDANGFEHVEVSAEPTAHMRATCGRPDSRWASFVSDSIERSIGRRPQVLPSNGGSLPNDIFADMLDLETVWIPHSYNSCCQHAPDEHLLIPVVREALAIMAGVWWDLGDRTLAPQEQ